MSEENRDSTCEISCNQEAEPLIPPRQPTYLNFRHHEPQVLSRWTRIILTVFKVSFCSLGLWGNQCWNYVPRVLFMVVCIYQVVYRMYVDFGCLNFDCHYIENLTDNNVIHKDDFATGNAVFTIFSLATVISYSCFIGCFIVAKRKDSALVSPAESLMANINELDVKLLFTAFVGIILSFIGLGASYYKLTRNQIKDQQFTVAGVTGTGAQLLSHWASINTCHVFAFSSSTIGKCTLFYNRLFMLPHKLINSCSFYIAYLVCLHLGTLAQNAISRIRDLRDGALDDVIRIHEDLCTVVFNTVSAYSVWFVVHWFTYGAGVVVAVIYISEESISRAKYHTHAIEFVFLGLLLACALYLFVFPCACAAMITSNCAGKITD